MNPLTDDVWGVWAEPKEPTTVCGQWIHFGGTLCSNEEAANDTALEWSKLSSLRNTHTFEARIKTPSVLRSVTSLTEKIGELVAEMKLSRESAPWERLQRLERAVEYLENSKDSKKLHFFPEGKDPTR